MIDGFTLGAECHLIDETSPGSSGGKCPIARCTEISAYIVGSFHVIPYLYIFIIARGLD